VPNLDFLPIVQKKKAKPATKRAAKR
jgi:hypothetical protein